MKKFKFMAVSLLASAMCLAGCDVNVVNDAFVEPGVVSVIIEGANAELNMYDTMDLDAKVTIVEDSVTAKGVKWSSSNEAVATVDEDGVVTPVSEGEVTITATSVFDENKKAQVTITVVDRGFSPALIDEGFAYSKDFPVNAVRGYIGDGEYVVNTVESKGGFYFMADEDYALVLALGDKVTDYNKVLSKAGWKSATGADTKMFIDPTYTYTVETMYDEMSYFVFYKNTVAWNYPTVLTTDTAWGANHVLGEDEAGSEFPASKLPLINEIPFIAMGEEYSIIYEDYSLYRMFGYDINDAIAIFDYTIEDSVLAGYDDILVNAEFVKGDKSEFGTDMYSKTIGTNILTVYTCFTTYGNCIYAEISLAPLAKFPEALVNDFAINTLGSAHAVPAMGVSSSSLKYTYEDLTDAYGEPTICICTIGTITKSQFTTYINKFAPAGYYSEDGLDNSEDSYLFYYAYNGKVSVEIYFNYLYDETNQAYNAAKGSLEMYVYNEFEADEPYITAEAEDLDVRVSVGNAKAVVYESFMINADDLTFASNDETIAIVEDGIVTGVAAGNTTVTVSYGGEVVLTYNVEVYVPVVYTNSVTFSSLYTDDTVVDGVEIETDDGAVISFAKNNGTADPKYYKNGTSVRLYGGNSMLIEAPEGQAITQVTITFGSSDGSLEIEASSGTLTDGVWVGNATAVEFEIEIAKGNRRISAVEVKFTEANAETVEYGSGGGDAEAIEQIMKDICVAVLGSSDDQYYYDSEYDYYYTYVSVSGATSSQLEAVTQYIVSLISGIVEYDEEFGVQPFESQSIGNGYEAYCYDSTGNIEVNVYSFVYDNAVCCGIDVYFVE